MLNKDTGEITHHPKFNERGEELMDPTPVAHSMRVRPVSEYARIRALIRHELSQEAANRGQETFEEANDFDVGDDFDPTTPYEEQFDPETGQSSFDVAGNPFVQERPVDQTKSKPLKGGDPASPDQEGENPPVDLPED